MIRVGLVGCGFIGTIHSLALEHLGRAGLVDARLVATLDADPGRAARLAAPHGARVASDLDDLLAGVDAVWVCTWTGAHRAVVEAAAAHGCAVFCEKPLAPSLAEAVAVADALERVPHQVGLVLRRAPVLRALAERLGRGDAGRPLAAVLRDDQYFPIQGMYASDWRADPARAGGGTLLEHSIHDLDLFRWLLGDPAVVRATTASRFGHADIDDVATVTLDYADGTMATLVSVWHQVLTRGSNRRLEVLCEAGVLWTDDDHLGPLRIERAAGAEEVVGHPPAWAARLELPPEVAVPLSLYAEPDKDFLDALAAPGRTTRPTPDAGTALAAHRLVDAAYRSAARGGAPVPVTAAPAARGGSDPDDRKEGGSGGGSGGAPAREGSGRPSR